MSKCFLCSRTMQQPVANVDGYEYDCCIQCAKVLVAKFKEQKNLIINKKAKRIKNDYIFHTRG
jgi:hypothetical protein